MNPFFMGTRPGRIVRHARGQFELPILYHREDSFGAAFTANAQKVRELMPSERLHPVLAPNGRGVILIGAFDYLSTSIGPYGEVSICVPVVHGRRPPPLLPVIFESQWPGFGLLVLHLPVTTRDARDIGRAEWGYAKFVADIAFGNTPEHLACRLSEGAEHILTMRVQKRGVVLPEQRPIITYSVRDRALIRTAVAQKTLARTAIGSADSSLELGDVHPVARSLRALDLETRPFMTQHYLDRTAVLPHGVIVERGVASLEGHHGADRERGGLRVPHWH